MRSTFLRILLVGGMASAAQAHHIWIEPTAQASLLRFGEFEENLHELSPGLLDKIPTPVTTLVGKSGEKSVTATKGGDAFALAGSVKAGENLVVEIGNYPIRELKSNDQITRSRWVPFARYIGTDFSPQAPRAGLDIVANGAAGKFKLFFNNQPLAKTKVTAIAPNGWTKELQSDERGEFEIKPLWKGIYALEAAMKDPTPGSWQGQNYDLQSYTTTLTFVQSRGDETTLPPVAQPHTESY